MTARTTSWRATTGRRSKKCFSTSRAAAFRKARREQTRLALGYCAASHQCDDSALLVSVDVVVAASAGIALLAGVPDHHLGVSAELHLAECRFFRARRRHPDRRRDSVGHPVSRAARLFDLVSRGDVGAQSRQPDDEPVEADRVSDLADGHEPDPARDRRHSDDAAGDQFIPFQSLRHRAAADRLLLQSDFHPLGGWHFRVGAGSAQRPRRRKHRLDTDVRPDAAGLHLLPGDGAAALASICRLGVAADLRIRGNAGAADRPCVSGRSDDRRAADQHRAPRCIIRDISCAFAQRTPAWLADPEWRISHLSKDLRDLRGLSRVYLPICALTHYYAFGTMLRCKIGLRNKCRLVNLAAHRHWWPKAVRRSRRRCTGCTRWLTRRSIRHGPLPTRRKFCLRIRLIRGRTPSSANPSPPAANCSSGRHAVTASRNGASTTPKSMVSAPRSKSARYGKSRSAACCISIANRSE